MVNRLTRLDEAVEESMAYIVLSEGRPFSYHDFLKFSVNGQDYTMSHGTFRNKISKFKKCGKVELSYYSSCAFYTLKGYKFGKQMTSNHEMVHNNPIYKMLRNLPFEKQSIHDIRLRFKVPNIWQVFSVNPMLQRNERSQDVAVLTWNKNNALVKIVIHKTDTVSVIIGCSLQPIPLDVNGIINFYNLLVRVEERLQSMSNNLYTNKKFIIIPDYSSWIVTMWHFGRDSSIEYTGEKFCISVEKLQHILTRIYVKDFKGKSKIIVSYWKTA